MLRSGTELKLALVICIAIAAVYAAVSLRAGQVPAASGLFGHGLGIVGFLLMILAETLYSLRKRSRVVRWGLMAGWLQFHVVTGIVGPFMVLLHSSWKFNGLAGMLTLLTVLIVISGFVGRYIYTRIPRTAEGLEIEGYASETDREAIANARRLMALWHTIHVPLGMALFSAALIHIVAAVYYATLLR
jgi:hypothetical protein